MSSFLFFEKIVSAASTVKMLNFRFFLLNLAKLLSEQDPAPRIDRKRDHNTKPVPEQQRPRNNSRLDRLDAGLLVDDGDAGGNPFDLILRDHELYRRLVLTMALERSPKENKDNSDQPPSEISEGFYWKDFPPLERLLFDSMEGYYTLSTNKRQSKQQQAFNNALVENIRSTAIESGYTFHSYFEIDDKRLRDRIRCFFKVRTSQRQLMTTSTLCFTCSRT